MYISRVELDIYNRQKIRDLTHLGAYHNWVEQSFREDNGVRSRKLWRLDKIN
ncbi:type I-E CRISPR-associated protein Cas6/Cse3/CasE, partial [Escherichia coli]